MTQMYLLIMNVLKQTTHPAPIAALLRIYLASGSPFVTKASVIIIKCNLECKM